MRLIDYIPEVLNAVSRSPSIRQTDLTVVLWGSSGKGNTSLTMSLFPHMVSTGLLNMRQKGRSKEFSITAKGSAVLAARRSEVLSHG